MKLSLLPKIIVPALTDVTEDLLRSRDIKLLMLDFDNTIAYESWPVYDEAKCKDSEVTIAVQVNGKMRGTVVMDADLDNDTVVQNVLANEKIAAFLAKQEGQIRKTIVVKNKLVNLIVK